MSMENKLRKPTQDQMPATVVDAQRSNHLKNQRMLLTTIGRRLSITCPTKIFFCRMCLKFQDKITQSLQLHLHLREKDRSTMSYKTSKLQRQRNPNQRLFQTQLNKFTWITENSSPKYAQDPKCNWNKFFFGIRRRVK